MDLNRKPLKLTAGWLVFFLLSSSASPSFAQAIEFRRDTVIAERQGKYADLSHPFWDNWFLSASAGVQVFFGDHNKRTEKYYERLTPAFELNAGKWLSPGIGVRAGLGGFNIKGLTQNGAHSTGKLYNESHQLFEQEFTFYQVQAEMLFNFHNIFQGFKKDRSYSLSPYVGLGWMQTPDEPKASEISANTGVLNSFRLNKMFDLTLDIRGVLVNDRFDGEIGGRKEEGILSTKVGLAYNFEQRGWNKPKTRVISYDEAALLALRDRINALEKDDDALRAQLAEAENETITDVKVENNMLASPILITFPISKSVVSNEARVNLGFFARAILQGNPYIVYQITGYADKGTGNAEINARLSGARAEAIRDVLINEHLVPRTRLETSYKGSEENMYDDDPRLSRAVITIAK